MVVIPSPFCKIICEIILFYDPIIQVVKKRTSEESTCNKSFAVLDSKTLHLQDWTSAVDHVLVHNQNYDYQSS